MTDSGERLVPTVDVAVPCYNYGAYLPDCVRSVLGQDGVEVRILIVDDASSDDTAEVAAELSRQHPNVHLLRHQSNLGHIRTFNDGIEWASASYFVLLSADDVLAPGALHRATAVMERHPNVGLVYGRVVEFGDVPPRTTGADAFGMVTWKGDEWIGRRCAAGVNPLHSPEIVLATAVQKSVGYYDERCAHASDLNMWLRAAATADVGKVIGPTQAYYRKHGANMSTQYRSPVRDLEERRLAFESFFDQAPERLRRQRAVAQRTLAREALIHASRALERADPDEAGALARFAAETCGRWHELPAARGYRARLRHGPRSWPGRALVLAGQTASFGRELDQRIRQPVLGGSAALSRAAARASTMSSMLRRRGPRS